VVSEAIHSKRAVIIVESAKLFREKGFGNATMRDIAEQVGMEAASLYNHIDNKDDILFAICQSVAEEYVLDLNTIEASSATVVSKLESIISSQIRVVSTNPNGVSVINHEWKYLSEKKRKEFFVQRRDYESRIEAIINTGVANSELIPVNAKIAMLTLLSSIRWVEFAVKATPNATFEQIEHQIKTVILSGIIK